MYPFRSLDFLKVDAIDVAGPSTSQDNVATQKKVADAKHKAEQAERKLELEELRAKARENRRKKQSGNNDANDYTPKRLETSPSRAPKRKAGEEPLIPGQASKSRKLSEPLQSTSKGKFINLL